MFSKKAPGLIIRFLSKSAFGSAPGELLSYSNYRIKSDSANNSDKQFHHMFIKYRSTFTFCFLFGSSESYGQFHIEQPGGEAVGDCEAVAGEILNNLVRYDIGLVEQVEYFQAEPDVFQFPEWTVTATHRLLIHQAYAEADVHPEV